MDGCRRTQAHAADLKVFFEAVGLKQVGELERANISALRPDFALEVNDDSAQVFQRIAGAQQFIPHSFTVEGQAQGLTGQLAIQPMGLLDGSAIHRRAGG